MLPKRLRLRRLVHLVLEAVSPLTKGERMASKKADAMHELAKAAAKGAAAAGVTSGGSLAAIGAGALAGTAGHVASTTLDHIRQGIARARGVEGPLGEATLVELEERGPELEAKLARLLEVAGDDLAKRARAVASFEAMIHAWMKASRRAADDRKRLERLDYGAVRLLHALDAVSKHSWLDQHNVLGSHEHSDFFESQLRGERFLPGNDGLVPTSLGLAALRFIREELQNHMREERAVRGK